MDLTVLKKKLSSYKTNGGYVKNVNSDLLMEILSAWESWTGPAKGFYAELGTNTKSGGRMIGEAKKLKREGFPTDSFKEVKVQESPSNSISLMAGPCQGIEILWDNGKLIRFPQVESLIDFLKKVA
jgi:hypothetical protein